MADSLWSLREKVRQVKPNCTEQQADQFINKWIQNIVKKRSWSDLLRTTAINVPSGYTTGTISTTAGSSLLTGTGTAWPVADRINGTFAQPTTDAPGQCEIHPDPATLSKVRQGDYLLLNLGGGTQEIVVVSYVGIDHFTALCRFNHAAAETIQASSLANLQCTLPTNQVVTVKAVLSATSIQADQIAAGVPVVNEPYYICLRYVRISDTAYRLKDAIDPVAGDQIGTDKTQEWLNREDPQRSTTGTNPLELVSMPPNPGGVMQWELWPAQTSAYVIPVLYIDGWPKLRNMGDLSPYFINEEIIVALAQGDALFTKIIAREGKTDSYYDPVAGQRLTDQGNVLLEEAIQQDDGRYMTSLQDWQRQLQGPIGNTVYDANHLDTWLDWGGY